MMLIRTKWLVAASLALLLGLLATAPAQAIPLNFNGAGNSFQMTLSGGGTATLSASANISGSYSQAPLGTIGFNGTLNLPVQNIPITLQTLNVNDPVTGTGNLTLAPNQPTLANATLSNVNANLLASPKTITTTQPIQAVGDVNLSVSFLTLTGELTLTANLNATLQNLTYQQAGPNLLNTLAQNTPGPVPQNFTTNYGHNTFGSVGQLAGNLNGAVNGNGALELFLFGISLGNVANVPLNFGFDPFTLDETILFPLGSHSVQDLEPGVFSGPGRDVGYSGNMNFGASGIPFPLDLPATTIPIVESGSDGNLTYNINGSANIALTANVTAENINVNLAANPANSPGLANPLQVPVLDVNPGSLDFGNVLVGTTSAPQSIGATNIGTDGSLLNVEFGGAANPFGPNGPQTINGVPEGGTVGRDYSFSPTIRGPAGTNVTVNSNGGSDTVSLSGVGVAPVSSLDTSGNDAGATLVGSTNNASVVLSNIGDGNLSGLGAVSNLNGTAPGGAGEFTLVSPAGISLGDGQSQQFDYQFAPTSRGVQTENLAFNMTNGSPNNMNQAHNINFQVTGQGVAPVSSIDTSANNAGFILVGQSGTASVTFENIGDGNLSGLGAVSNLNGNVQVSAGDFTLVGGNSMSLADGASQTFDYTYTPTVVGAANEALTANFTNGDPTGQNLNHTWNYNLVAQAVAPIADPVNQVNNNAGFTLVGTTNPATIGIVNVGDGNLSGLGAISNLNGSVQTPVGEFSTASPNFSVPDGSTQFITYDFAPSSRGFQSVGGTVSYTNGSPDGMNQAHVDGFILEGTGVAPVSTTAIQTNNDAGYTLVGTSNQLTIGVQNVGDGNLSGLGAISNLNGTASSTLGDFSIVGSNTFSIPDGQTHTLTYDFSPQQRGFQQLPGALNYSNGSPDEQNNPHNRNFNVRGTGVAPVQDVTSNDNAGLVRIGTSATLPPDITITNTGDGNLSGLGAVSNLNGNIDGGTDGRFVGGSAAFSLADGASQQFPFVYTPTTHTVDSSTVTIGFSNGSADGTNSAETVQVTLSGQGVGPIYDSTPPPGPLNFGDVVIGSNGQLTLDISNISTDPNGGDTTLTDLTLISAVISGPDGAEFSIDGFTPGTVLSQGDVLNLVLNFDPLFPAGDKFATLTILTDQGAPFGLAGASFIYDLMGVAVPEPASMVVFGLCTIGGLGFYRWRRRRQQVA